MVFWKNKSGVRKIYNHDKKYWDYEIINEPNWKPKHPTILTKDKLKTIDHNKYFTKKIININDIKNNINLYSNHNNKNNLDFNEYLLYKRYQLYKYVLNSYYILSKKFINKNIYYYDGNFQQLIYKYPELNRLKSTLKTSSNNINELGIIIYWEFVNSIIFIF